MIFGHDRLQLRKFYQDCWQKKQSPQPLQAPLTALENQVVEVIEEHPEYHEVIGQRLALDSEWFPEQGKTNPFLHLGMHLAIREQLTIDQPKGIRDVTRALLKKIGEPHEVEHLMIDCLAEAMWVSQRENQEADMFAYLECLRRL